MKRWLKAIALAVLAVIGIALIMFVIPVAIFATVNYYMAPPAGVIAITIYGLLWVIGVIAVNIAEEL